ncbi:hypothetical protein Hypma_005871 [Hypsizygus marmoreus]|uniref:Uncharacterized protein n=1 Tax=Hypsizygus marmoreus TaxID=39966 RepID=A0A369KD72_HYPMA|nr:hypothetical protein Hypma_005871 [Hypsizygus marmoreus]
MHEFKVSMSDSRPSTRGAISTIDMDFPVKHAWKSTPAEEKTLSETRYKVPSHITPLYLHILGILDDDEYEYLASGGKMHSTVHQILSGGIWTSLRCCNCCCFEERGPVHPATPTPAPDCGCRYTPSADV